MSFWKLVAQFYIQLLVNIQSLKLGRRFKGIQFFYLSFNWIRGCVLSSNVVVGTNVVIAPFTRIGSCKHPDEEVRFDLPYSLTKT